MYVLHLTVRSPFGAYALGDRIKDAEAVRNAVETHPANVIGTLVEMPDPAPVADPIPDALPAPEPAPSIPESEEH